MRKYLVTGKMSLLDGDIAFTCVVVDADSYGDAEKKYFRDYVESQSFSGAKTIIAQITILE